MFSHVASIIVEKKDNLDQAMEDAISFGADDVEEFVENDTECFEVQKHLSLSLSLYISNVSFTLEDILSR